jgi:hypothetical protein
MKTLLTPENFAKLVAGVFMLAGQFFMIKTEIHDNKTKQDADNKIFNYRLMQVEKCCDIKPVAILPKETKIEIE